jgi:protein phosphatase
VCQVQKEHVGTAVRCPRCAKPFVATEAQQPPSPPAPAQPQQQPALAPSGGWWEGLKGVVRSLATPFPQGEKPPRQPGDTELEMELDGPAAAGAREKPAAARGVRLDAGSATHTGRVRNRNEDSTLLQHLAWSTLDEHRALVLAAVADGMGGYDAGDRASNLTVRQLAADFAPVFANATTQLASGAALAAAIDQAIKNANRIVFQQAQAAPGCKGMGATLAVVVVAGEEVRIGHVGDCRVYHFGAGGLRQLTRDQTLVARMVELGKLTAAEALTHPQRNEVSHALGRHPELQPVPYEAKLNVGDMLVLASDGLQAHVDDKAIAAAAVHCTTAGALAEQLVQLANTGPRSGSDNCSVVVIRRY